MTRQHPQTIAAARLLENLSPTVWAALEHLRDEMRATDGYGSGGTSDGGSRSTSTTSTTERAAMALDALVDQSSDIKRTVTDIVALIDNLGRLCQRAISTRVAKPAAVLCSSEGLTGADEWGDPNCTNVPRAATGGLCHNCNMRSSRWRNAASLKPVRLSDSDNLRSFHFDIVEGVASAWGRPFDAA
jgi:hypothetical protein